VASELAIHKMDHSGFAGGSGKTGAIHSRFRQDFEYQGLPIPGGPVYPSVVVRRLGLQPIVQATTQLRAVRSANKDCSSAAKNFRYGSAVSTGRK
jgi:hypothetical protein